MIRHHRLIELFLAEVLGMPWDRVHDEAEVLEHHISEELEELIAAKLGQPARDPHGDPIPSRELDIEADRTVALSELEVGRRRRLRARLRPRPRDAPLPGLARDPPRGGHRVTGREPFEGPISVRVAGIRARARRAAGAAHARQRQPRLRG